MIIVATSVVVRIERRCTGGAEPECPTRSARSADVNCFCCWWTQSGALCSKPPAEGQRRRRGKNPQPGGLSQWVFQEALQGLTPSTACTLSVPSLKNWKRGCLSYLPILSEPQTSGRAQARVGDLVTSWWWRLCAIPAASWDTAEKVAQTISLHSAARFRKHIAPGARGPRMLSGGSSGKAGIRENSVI